MGALRRPAETNENFPTGLRKFGISGQSLRVLKNAPIFCATLFSSSDYTNLPANRK